MKGLDVKINGSDIRANIINIIARGGDNQYECDFKFDEDWDSLNKTAVFEGGDIVKQVIIDNDVCRVPDEVLKEDRFSLSVLGVLNQETIYTTKQINIPVYQGSKDDTGDIPTPDIFQQYVYVLDEKLKESKEILEENKTIKEDTIAESQKIIQDGTIAIENIKNNAIIDIGNIKEETQQIKDDTILEIGQLKSDIIKVKDDGVIEINKAVSDNIDILQGIKNDTQQIKDSAIAEIDVLISDSTADLNAIKQETEDIRDVAQDFVSAVTFSTFEIDVDTGEMVINTPEKLANAGFSLNYETGNLEVGINE